MINPRYHKTLDNVPQCGYTGETFGKMNPAYRRKAWPRVWAKWGVLKKSRNTVDIIVHNLWISLKNISSYLSSSAFLYPAFRLAHCAHLIVSQTISTSILPCTEVAPFHTIHFSKSPLCCQLFLFCLLQGFFLSGSGNSYHQESICPSLGPLDFPTK